MRIDNKWDKPEMSERDRGERGDDKAHNSARSGEPDNGARAGVAEERHRNRRKRRWLLILVAVIAVAMGAVGVNALVGREEARESQRLLAPFYLPPVPLPDGRPGDVIRTEPFNGAPEGAIGWRVLYLTERSDGSKSVSSGMVFAPAEQAPGRPVVAWAHGTVGLGDECAPSRSASPLGDMSWLSGMIANGWVVAATDYAGLGTPGVSQYLVGRAEARDVINSVRAAQQITAAGNRFAVWGHSQGGHSALWAAHEAAKYAPELDLVAAAAAAPAAELAPLMQEQYDSVIGWVIGADVLMSWPRAYEGVEVGQVATSTGEKVYENLSEMCIDAAALDAEVRQKAGERMFKVDPTTVPSWYSVAISETPPALSPRMPVLVAQGLNDEVVLPNTTALLTERLCGAGSNLTSIWLGDTNHLKAASVSGPAVTTWLQQRFDGVAVTSTCGTTTPVAPAATPPQPL